MRREVSLEEISDGKLYDANDMVKADSHNCEGCHECCEGMGDSVVLDPLDVNRLCTGLGKNAQELAGLGLIQFDAMDGNILPHLCMTSGEKEQCRFLNEQGRCSIHAFRPGFCRLFPLGRFYENGSFRYFLQVHECPKTNRSKIKVKKWIDTPDLKQYEKFVSDWHYFLLKVQEVLEGSEDTELIKNLNLYVVNRFYLAPYDEKEDFYTQFYARLTQAQELLSLADE